MPKDLLYELGINFIASLYVLEFYTYEDNTWDDYAYSVELVDILNIITTQDKQCTYRIYNAKDFVLAGVTSET